MKRPKTFKMSFILFTVIYFALFFSYLVSSCFITYLILGTPVEPNIFLYILIWFPSFKIADEITGFDMQINKKFHPDDKE